MVPVAVWPHAFADEVHAFPSPAGLAGVVALQPEHVKVPALVVPHAFAGDVQALPQVEEHAAFDGHAAEVPSQRSSTSQPLATGRHTWLAPSKVQVPSAEAPAATLHASHAPAQAVSQHTPSAQKFDRHCTAALQLAPAAFFAAQYMPLHHVASGQPAPHRIGQSVSVPLHTTLPPHAGEPGSFAGDGRQVPTLLARLQRSQLPVHAWSQHTPSAQKPDSHSRLVPQLSPVVFAGSQLPLAQ